MTLFPLPLFGVKVACAPKISSPRNQSQHAALKISHCPYLSQNEYLSYPVLRPRTRAQTKGESSSTGAHPMPHRHNLPTSEAYGKPVSSPAVYQPALFSSTTLEIIGVRNRVSDWKSKKTFRDPKTPVGLETKGRIRGVFGISAKASCQRIRAFSRAIRYVCRVGGLVRPLVKSLVSSHLDFVRSSMMWDGVAVTAVS
ncbi:hypothetical protein BKA61DRAFT_359876 [Leptodontidium sp. MPI-SDFR-AT-0119]|nr:hypothetical protein BKA61DRAFT_359876 [Leptodontidium sp. MPI-SDFR-AT-0119]